MKTYYVTMTARDLRVARGLRRVRLASGMKLKEAAAIYGCSTARACQMETGYRAPMSVKSIAAIYGVTAEEVIALCSNCGFTPPPLFTCQVCGSNTPLPAEALALTLHNIV